MVAAAAAAELDGGGRAAEEVDGSRSKLVNRSRGEEVKGLGPFPSTWSHNKFLRRSLSSPPESLKNIDSPIHQTGMIEVLRM